MSKQSSGVEKRHGAERETLGKVAGGWQEAVHGRRTQGIPQSPLQSPESHLGSRSTCPEVQQEWESCKVTACCWHVWVLARIPPRWGTESCNHRGLPSEMWTPFRRSKTFSKFWTLVPHWTPLIMTHGTDLLRSVCPAAANSSCLREQQVKNTRHSLWEKSRTIFAESVRESTRSGLLQNYVSSSVGMALKVSF